MTALSDIITDPPFDLDEALDESLADPDSLEVRAPWRITDDDGAEWAMGKLASARAVIARNEAQFAEWHDRLVTSTQARNRRALATERFMAQRIAEYVIARREADPRAKSLSLPSGVARTTERKPKVEIEDEMQVLDWAHGAGVLDAITNPPKVSMTALREVVSVTDDLRVVDENGEVVPGVYVEPARITCTVTAAADAEPF